MSVQYEVINLETKEVVPASIATIGNVTDEYTEVSFVENGEEKTVRFSNIENEGNLLHEQYAIREVGTQLTPNVDGVVTDEGVEVEITQEVRAEIQAGNVDPDTIK